MSDDMGKSVAMPVAVSVASVSERPTLLREFTKHTPEDPSAFISAQIYSPHDKLWKVLFDIHCDLSVTDRSTLEYLGSQTWPYAQDAISLVDASLQSLGWNVSGSWRVRQESDPVIAPPPDVVVPIAPASSSERKDQALERIARVNPHLARMATEVQELLLWDQYANGALGALIRVYALDLDEISIVSKACKFADAMMEARLTRVKRPIATPVEAQAQAEAQAAPTSVNEVKSA